MEWVLEARGLSKIYKAKTRRKQKAVEAVHAVDGVDLQIAAGDYVAIMGPSGSGKSTLMQILGLLDRATSGSLKIMGHEVSKLSDNQLAKLRSQQIGFIFQFFNLLARTTALDNVALPMLYAHSGKDITRAQQLLEKVNLSDRMLHTPQELSGGQQQRVAIARSMANSPQILMCDEPTGNISTQQANEIMDMIGELNAQGVTVIVITHEAEVAQRAKRIIHIRDGKIVSDERNSPVSETGQVAAPVSILKKTSRIYLPMLWENTRMAFKALTANPIRTFLTMLGVIIGVMAVITMVAISTGASQSVAENLSRLGTNLIAIRPENSRALMAGFGRAPRLKIDDALALRKLKQMGYPIRDVGVELYGAGQLKYGNKTWNSSIDGVWSNHQSISNIKIQSGSFIEPKHDHTQERVVVLGQTVVKNLFDPGTSPVGSTVKINRNDYRVIGVMAPRGGGGMGDPDNIIMVPVNTAMKRIFGKLEVTVINVEALNPDSMTPLMDALEDFMRKRRDLRPGQENDFTLINYADIQATVAQSMKTISLLLASVAIVSLLVGGIGIMNIMLVSVKERTREIGLRKALGATRFDILFQFMIESVVVSITGGMIGVLAGSGIALLIASLAKWPVGIQAQAIFTAVTFAAAVGIIFGMWPARQASNLSPIEALRSE